jgi:hypothetical protein
MLCTRLKRAYHLIDSSCILSFIQLRTPNKIQSPTEPHSQALHCVTLPAPGMVGQSEREEREDESTEMQGVWPGAGGH